MNCCDYCGAREDQAHYRKCAGLHLAEDVLALGAVADDHLREAVDALRAKALKVLEEKLNAHPR